MLWVLLAAVVVGVAGGGGHVKLETTDTWALQAWGVDHHPDSADHLKMVDVDMFGQKDDIKKLREEGHIVICYVDVGSVESERPDVKANPVEWDEIKGAKMGGWPEWWINLTKLDLVKKLIGQRFTWAAEWGCHGVEPDNTDCYDNTKCQQDTLHMSKEAAKKLQIEYNTWQTNFTHNLNLAIGLKNTGDLAPQTQHLYDFAVVEQCIEYGDCTPWQDFIKAKKAVYGVEYKKKDDNCQKFKSMGWLGKQCSDSGSEQCPSDAHYEDCFDKQDPLPPTHWTNSSL